jgi:hypothetical protein
VYPSPLVTAGRAKGGQGKAKKREKSSSCLQPGMKPYMEVAARSLLDRHFLAIPPYSSRQRFMNSACIVPQELIDHKPDMHTEDETTAKISSRHKIQVCSFGCVITSSRKGKRLLIMHNAEETCRE